jgi:hypothetical protein
MRRLGVLGTLVLDTIHLPGPSEGADSDPLTDWGGIAYTLSALEAVAPDGWEVFPIVKVGSDLRERADDFFADLERVSSREGIVSVVEPNNRVDLYYGSGPRRCEKLTGGVPGWTWPELGPLADDCDAMIVNFIAGWELDLETARRLRAAHRGPLYADIHSLLLAVREDGIRVLQTLPEWAQWRACFDFLQMNEEELTALAGDSGDPEATARETVRSGPRALFVTRGATGASWYERSGTTGHEAPEAIAPGFIDPTGCGDVWGAACAASLLDGSNSAEAARRGNRLAGAAVRHSGTGGLADILRAVTHAGEPA